MKDKIVVTGRPVCFIPEAPQFARSAYSTADEIQEDY